MSVNKAILVGRLGADPEFKQTQNGNSVCKISVATTEKYKDKNTGQMKEETEWHRVVFWNKQAEIVNQYLKKGSQCYIEGKNKTRKYQDQQGQDRYAHEIQGSVVQFIGGGNNQQSTTNQPQANQGYTTPQPQQPQQQWNGPQPAQNMGQSQSYQQPSFQTDDIPF